MTNYLVQPETCHFRETTVGQVHALHEFVPSHLIFWLIFHPFFSIITYLFLVNRCLPGLVFLRLFNKFLATVTISTRAPVIQLKPRYPILPNQFASSKTNIVFNQMQLGLQVKIFSQLKLIKSIISLGESWVTTTCQGSPPITNNKASQCLCSTSTVCYRKMSRKGDLKTVFIQMWFF